MFYTNKLKNISKMLTILGILSLMMNLSYGNITTETITNKANNEIALFDFTKADSTADWIEQSDTVREVGMSKAVFAMQKTQVFSRAIFFTLLNPQPNGAGFAGIRIVKSYDLNNFNKIVLKLRAQGENINYKIILRHKGQNDEPYPTWEQFFTAPYKQFEEISLPFDDFKAYYRGKPVNDSEPLDTANITSIGIQIYGGVYLDKKQSGSSTLEIDWIKVSA